MTAMTKKNIKMRGRQGFSLIEIMVAATIMIMIVMMLGALFQQTSTAWRTGVMRAGGYMQLRSFVGTLQRDASAMINANMLPKELLDGGTEQGFSNGRLQFYTMSTRDDKRTLSFITYDLSGTRTVRVKRAESDSWENDGEPAELIDFLKGNDNDMLVNPLNFEAVFNDNLVEYDRDGKAVGGNQRFPMYLRVESRVMQKGALYDVGAESAGPDKQWNTKDDIRTFVNK